MTSTREIIKRINLECVPEGWLWIKLSEAVKIKACQNEEELKYAEFFSILDLILI